MNLYSLPKASCPMVFVEAMSADITPDESILGSTVPNTYPSDKISYFVIGTNNEVSGATQVTVVVPTGTGIPESFLT